MKHEILDKLNPCAEGKEFAEQFKTPSEAWERCERGDWMMWILRKTNKLDKPTAVKIAIACSEHVIGIYSAKYPDDKRPQNAIDAAKKWLIDPSDENRRDAADAAAAAAAADAAAAAAAAAYAAYAAAAADADAADAAAYAAADARTTERKWQANKIREIYGAWKD